MPGGLPVWRQKSGQEVRAAQKNGPPTHTACTIASVAVSTSFFLLLSLQPALSRFLPPFVFAIGIHPAFSLQFRFFVVFVFPPFFFFYFPLDSSLPKDNMSFAASAAFIGPTLYVYYYSSANTAATFGSLFAFANAPNSTNTLLIANQTITSQGPSPVSAPSGAWMFSNSNKQLLLFLSQSPQKIITLLPQSTPEPLVAPVFWNNTNINNVNWSFTDQSSAPNLFPTGGLPPLWIASGNSGSSEGSSLYEIYAAAPFSIVNKLDISNMASLTVSQSTSGVKPAGNIDPSLTPRVVRLPGSVVSNVNDVAVGKCTTSAGTCMTFFIDSSPSAIFPQPQANPAYDPTSCIIATNSLIVMVTKTGIWTFNYTVSRAALQAATWGSISKSVLPNAPLSCSVSGTQLFVVLQGGSQPTIVVASMTGTWAWQTQTLTAPSVIPSPTPAPTGSTGQSGGPPDAGGNSSIDGSSTNHSGSQLGSSSTGLREPVIIAIAVVAAVLLIFIPTLFIWWCRRKRQNGKEREQRTEELKKYVILEQRGGKRMGSPQTTVLEYGGGKRMGSPQTIVPEHGGGNRMESPHTLVLEHGGGNRMDSPHTLVLEHGGGNRIDSPHTIVQERGMGSPQTHPEIDPAHTSLTLVEQ